MDTMTGRKACNVAFAGGACMMTMMTAGDKLSDRCEKAGLRVHIDYVDLWTSDYLRPGIDLVIEMFPYYKKLSIPIVSGRPFALRTGESELLAQLVERIREISQP
jgi:hypothetical protein